MPDDLVKLDPSLPTPAYSAAQMEGALVAYRELQAVLDRQMPDQIMTIRDRRFRKKGYWRAVAVAFNLEVICVHEERQILGTTMKNDDDWGYSVTYRARTASGIARDGDGACYASEKRGQGQATEHNVRSHAHTRAFNRAVSNLVGFGEVSAEEVRHEDHPRAPDFPADENGAVQGDARLISQAQGKRLYAIWKQRGWSDAQVKDLLLHEWHLQSTRDIPRRLYEKIVAQIQAGPVTAGADEQPFG